MGYIADNGQMLTDRLVQVDNWCQKTPVSTDGAFPVWTLCVPDGEQAETLNVIEEILPASGQQGCYNVDKWISPGELWVDVGSHVGVFSIAALMRGAIPIVMVDQSDRMLLAARWNVNAFTSLVEAMQSLPAGAIVSPYPAHLTVETANDITSLIGERVHNYVSGIKIDIQGAEETVLTPIGARELIRVFDKLVVEWHDPEKIDQAVYNLEIAGWKIESVQRHTDVLLEIDTHILYAKRE